MKTIPPFGHRLKDTNERSMDFLKRKGNTHAHTNPSPQVSVPEKSIALVFNTTCLSHNPGKPTHMHTYMNTHTKSKKTVF